MKKMDYEEFANELKQIPGDEGFWRSSTQDAYNEAADRLIEKGFSREETLSLLRSLFSATANEFGN